MSLLENLNVAIWTDHSLWQADILSWDGSEVCMPLKKACDLCTALIIFNAARAVD